MGSAISHGIYEWRDEGGTKKQQYKIAPNGNEPGLAFTGIHDRCVTADRGEIHFFTIMTHQAGRTIEPYHSRAPLALFG